jgi:CBS domain containing-hemolysin-like protein/mannitol/fructose-specific phosphotransferase system IIA component (Ntr-type)
VATFLLAALLIFINGLFVLMEYSLVKVRSSRIELLARKGNPRALAVQEIQGRFDDYLAALQFGITLVALALGWLGEPAVAEVIQNFFIQIGVPLPPHAMHLAAFAVALAALGFTQSLFGELLPRAVGIQKAETFALLGARPLQLFALSFRLPVRIMSSCSQGILKLLGLKPAAHSDQVVSEEEMRILIGETQERGTLPLERLLLLENLFDLGAAKVSEAMVPRDKVVYLSLSKPFAENLEIIRSKRFSRYLLCEQDLDTAVGFVHVKDLLLKAEDGKLPDLKRLRRDLTEVLESDPLEKLLKAFPDKGVHMALVRNGLGKIVGLVTLEDIIEELIGEVHDEFDLPQAWSLMDLLVPQAVAVGLPAQGRKEAIVEVLNRLCATDPQLKSADVLNVVWEREMKFSSAVGRGVAVPHGRLPGLEKPMVGVGRFVKPVPFPAPDNAPVRLVFLILTPASAPVVQLKVLGRIASLITNENLRRKILRAKTSESLLEILRTADTLLAG